jgi:hypothetical protein
MAKSRRHNATRFKDFGGLICVCFTPRKRNLNGDRRDVRFGSLTDICSAPTYVRFAPNSDRYSGHGR